MKSPFQIVGGLAATIHGGSRPVADIDLYIPKEFAESVLPSVGNYISKPLCHYVEHGWDLDYLRLARCALQAHDRSAPKLPG